MLGAWGNNKVMVGALCWVSVGCLGQQLGNGRSTVLGASWVVEATIR